MTGYYINLGFRNFKKNKALTILMILAIAVGIGASMTTLTVMHLLSGDPLPDRSEHIYYPQVDADPGSKGREPYDLLDYKTAMDLWNSKRADRQALIANSQVKLRLPDANLPPLMLPMLSTTSDFFPMFDTPFRYGRGWNNDEDNKHARVAVISSDLNSKLFGGANSVGRTLRLKDNDVRIIGVLAPWRPSPLFYNVRAGRFANGHTAEFYTKPEDIFIPFTTGIEINDGNFQPFTCWSLPDVPGYLKNSDCVWIALWVQINESNKVEDYRKYLADYAAQQKELGRITQVSNTRLRTLMQWLDFNGVVPRDVKLQTWLSFAFLTICLCNVAGLLLAKFLYHSSEIALRRALGATRATIFTQSVVEAALVGVLGGIGGLILTLFGLSLIRRQPVAYADFVHLDLSMFLVTFGLALLVSLLAGILPASRAARVEPALQLKGL